MLDIPSADLLKCGSCCTEFPLSDIVVFIQHKTKPCKSDLDENGLRCSSCSETFKSAHSLLKHAQFTHKINIFIEKNTTIINNNNELNQNLNTKNEIYIDLIPTNSSSNTNYSNIDKQLFDITVSSSPTSSTCSSSEKNYNNQNENTNEKLSLSKTECNSQHLVYQNENTSSSSTSSSMDLSSVKYENVDKFCSSSSPTPQNDFSKQQQSQHENEISGIINSLSSTPSKRTKSVSCSSDEKRREKKTKQAASFYCDICHAAFNQKIHLTKHSAKHTGIKPFKCSECNYSTVERSHLKVHVRVHTGEKPFKCSFCEYATAQSSTLKIHKKRHHSLSLLGANNELTNQNSSKCPIYSNTNGDMHSNNVHGFNIEQMDMDTKMFQTFSKRSKFDLNSKLKDQRNNNNNFTVELNQENDFKQDVMIISFESNSIHSFNNNNNKKIVNSLSESSLNKQMTDSENKLLGLANIALERETN